MTIYPLMLEEMVIYIYIYTNKHIVALDYCVFLIYTIQYFDNVGILTSSYTTGIHANT